MSNITNLDAALEKIKELEEALKDVSKDYIMLPREDADFYLKLATVNEIPLLQDALAQSIKQWEIRQA